MPIKINRYSIDEETYLKAQILCRGVFFQRKL